MLDVLAIEQRDHGSRFGRDYDCKVSVSRKGKREQGLTWFVKLEVTSMAATPLHMTDYLCVVV